MKIAYLSTFYPFRGGIAQFNASLFNELNNNNEIIPYTFTLQYPNFLFPGETQYVQENDNATKINSIQILNSINPFSYIKTAKEIKKNNFDLLLTKFWMPYFAPSLGYIAKKIKKNTVSISILDNVIPHEMRLGDLQLIRYFLNRNDGFVVMSETVKNDLLKLKPNAKFIYHQHPLYEHFGKIIKKNEAREKLNLPKDKIILLCYGFIRDYKGLDLAIQTIEKLNDNYHLVIAGEVYGTFNKYSELINSLNVSNKISKHLHYISDEETALFFSAADICLLPYKSATQSGIIASSFNFDLPVIATRTGSLAEMIEPFDNGIIADGINPNSIKDAILKFDNFKKDYFTNNIKKYKKIATWDNLAVAITNFAKELKK